MGNFPVEMMTNEDPDFYNIMGPYLSQREIVRELGGPIWDDSGKLWFIAIDENEVVGFAAIVIKGKRARFCSDWVRLEYRNLGIYDALMHSRIEYVDGKCLPATTIATLKAAHTFKRYGFIPDDKRKMKNYICLKRGFSDE